MATPAVNFNPYLQTVAAGSFNVSSEGFIAGTLLDHPTELFKIAGGIDEPFDPVLDEEHDSFEWYKVPGLAEQPRGTPIGCSR